MAMRVLLMSCLLATGCQPLLTGNFDEPAMSPRSSEWLPSLPAAERAPVHYAYTPMPRQDEHPAAFHARSLLGRPYCWGGAGPDCFDCSGLVYASWRAAGINLPRSSDAMFAKLGKVPWSALQPGDILWRPGHVGLYVGDGWAIHAPGRGKRVRYQPASTYQYAMRP